MFFARVKALAAKLSFSRHSREKQAPNSAHFPNKNTKKQKQKKNIVFQQARFQSVSFQFSTRLHNPSAKPRENFARTDDPAG